MPQKWVDIENDERFGELSFEQKTAVRDKFFEDYVAPHARNEDELRALHQGFLEKTQFPDDKPWSERLGERVTARGQQAIGGGIRAVGESITSGETYGERMGRQFEEAKFIFPYESILFDLLQAG